MAKNLRLFDLKLRKHLLAFGGIALLLAGGLYAAEPQKGKGKGNNETILLYAELVPGLNPTITYIAGDSSLLPECSATGLSRNLGVVWFGPCLDPITFPGEDPVLVDDDIVLIRGHLLTYSENGVVVGVQPRFFDELDNMYSGGYVDVFDSNEMLVDPLDWTMYIEATGVEMKPYGGRGKKEKKGAEAIGTINIGNIVFTDCQCGPEDPN